MLFRSDLGIADLPAGDDAVFVHTGRGRVAGGPDAAGGTVVEPYSYTNLAEYRPESIEQYDERVTAEAEERLEAARKIAVAAGVEVKTVMVKSFSPAEAIIEQAEKNGCDIIFMASHGRKGIAAVLLGSETQKVLTHSHFPVMVYR